MSESILKMRLYLIDWVLARLPLNEQQNGVLLGKNEEFSYKNGGFPGKWHFPVKNSRFSV